jgi:hypothetical protein
MIMKGNGTTVAKVLISTTAILLAASSLSQESITFRYEGEVTSVAGQFAANGINIGDRITGTYAYDPNVPARYPPPPPIFSWDNALLRWTISVGSETASGTAGTPFADLEIYPAIWAIILDSSGSSRLSGDELQRVVLEWDRQVGFGPNWTLPRTPGFRFPGKIFVSASNSGLEATLTRVTYQGADSEFPASPAVWRAKPTPEQVPASASVHRGSKLNASLWFDDGQKIATLSLTDRYSEASPPRLYCALAGQQGELIWQAVSIPPGAEKRWKISREDLLLATGCDSNINTIAGLRGTAAKRLVYVEFERGGVTHRGQLWPKDLMADRVHVASAVATESQVVVSDVNRGSSRINARIRLNERDEVLSGIEYFIDGSNAPETLTSAALHCAPAGVEGPVIADLQAASRSTRWIRLTTTRLQPTGESNACGLEINTVASVVEAYLQGNLYFRLEASDGQVWRGQIPRP